MLEACCLSSASRTRTPSRRQGLAAHFADQGRKSPLGFMNQRLSVLYLLMDVVAGDRRTQGRTNTGGARCYLHR